MVIIVDELVNEETELFGESVPAPVSAMVRNP
jgi:hypothetical protein